MTFQPTTSVCTYTDSVGSIAGELVNNGTLLLVRLGEIVLLGYDFSGLQPKDPDSLPDRFTLQHGFICNCFGCQFADYIVYGNGACGNMMCFRNVKERYNAGNDPVQGC